MKALTLRLEKDLYEELRLMARTNHSTISHEIRLAIVGHVFRMERSGTYIERRAWTQRRLQQIEDEDSED